MNGCSIKQTGTNIVKSLLDILLSYKLSDMSDEQIDSLSNEINNYVKTNFISLGYLDLFKLNTLRQLLDQRGLDYITIDTEDVNYRPQLHPRFSYLSIANLNKLFGTNDAAATFVKSKFVADTLKYSIINRSKNATVHIYRTPEELNLGIREFKNKLCQDIILTLDIKDIDPDTIFFSEYGCDYDAYNALMNSIKISPINPSNLQFNKDSKDWDVFYDLFVLNNFDTLLEEELEGIIDTNSPNRGMLDRSDYSFGIFNGDEDVHMANDLMYENASEHIQPLAKKIIQSIPKVVINGKKVSEVKDSFLSINDLFLFSGLFWDSLIQYNLTHPNQELDMFENPHKAIKTILQDIYEGTVKIKSRNLSEFELLKIDQLRKLTSWLNTTKNTALSLYYYIYDSPTKNNPDGDLDIHTIELEEQRNGIISGLSIEESIIWEILKTVAPTYLQYDKNGLLIDSNGKRNGKIIYPAKLMQNLFSLKRGIGKLIRLGSFGDLEKNQIYIALNANYEKTGYGDLTKNKHFVQLINLLIGNLFDFSSNDNFKEIFIDQSSNVLGQLIELFEIIKTQIEWIKKLPNFDYINICNNLEEYEELVKTEFNRGANNYSDTTKFYNLQKLLAPLYGTVPATIFKDITGASIPVYRQYSMMFGDHHFINRYKKLDQFEEENLMRNPEYIPLRRRSNFFVDHPGVFTAMQHDKTMRNELYSGSTAIRLSVGTEFANAESRKLSVFAQVALNFIGDYISLLGAKDDNGSPAYMAGTLIGVLSDKTTIPVKMINANYKLNNIPIRTLLNSGKYKIIRSLDREYRFTSQLDLVDYILTNWNLILDQSNLKLEYEMSNKIPGKSKIYEMLRNADNFKLSNNNKNNLLTEIYQLELKAIEKLNSILSVANFKDSDFLTDTIAKVATNLGIEFIPELFLSKYKDGVTFNRYVLYDLQNLSSEKAWNEYQDKCFNEMMNGEVIYSGETLRFIDALKKYIEMKASLEGDDFTSVFVQAGFTEILDKNKVNISKLQEALKTYLSWQNFIRHQYLDLTNKEAYTDPDKSGSTDITQEISQRLIATSKRNVNFGGTIAPYLMRRIGGVGKKTNVGIVDTVEEQVFNLLGKTAFVDIFDGCGFISPILARMEGQSLGNSKNIDTLKTLGTWNSDYYSAEAKWAEHTITNSMIRDSKNGKFDLEVIFEMMHNIPFNEDINLCLAFYEPEDTQYLIMQNLLGNNYYFSDGINTYALEGLVYTGNNTYTRMITPVDINGNEIGDSIEEEITINSLYDLYKALGGYMSMELSNGKLIFSENVMDALYQIVIRTGLILDDSDEYNQDTVYQPLRDKMIHILPTKSSIKRTWVNMNSNKVWTDYRRTKSGDLARSLNYFQVDLSLTGEQLKAFHLSEDAEATETTQALATQNENGFDPEHAQEIYSSLYSIIEANSSEIQNRTNLLQLGKWDEVVQTLSEKILEDLKLKAQSPEIEATIAKYLRRATNAGKELELPISQFASSVSKELIQGLNKNVARRKYKNSLGAVMKPTSNIKQVYTFNGKPYLYTDIIQTVINLNENYKNAILEILLDQNIIKTDWSDIQESLEEVPQTWYDKKAFKDKLLFNVGAAILMDKDVINIVTKFLKILSDNKNRLSLDLLNKIEKYLPSEIKTLLDIKNTIKNSILFINEFATDPELFAIYLSVYPKILNANPNKFLLMESISASKVLPLDSIIYENDFVTLDTLSKYQYYSGLNEEIIIDRSKPADLKPKVTLKTCYNADTNSQRTENEYNSYACILNSKILQLISAVKKNDLTQLKAFGREITDQCN